MHEQINPRPFFQVNIQVRTLDNMWFEAKRDSTKHIRIQTELSGMIRSAKSCEGSSVQVTIRIYKHSIYNRNNWNEIVWKNYEK